MLPAVCSIFKLMPSQMVVVFDGLRGMFENKNNSYNTFSVLSGYVGMTGNSVLTQSLRQPTCHCTAKGGTYPMSYECLYVPFEL